LLLSCPGIADLTTRLRVTEPATAQRTGTIIFSTGGDGTNFYRDTSRARPLFEALDKDGWLSVEVAWDSPGIWQGEKGPRSWSCRYATAARWIYDNLHQGGQQTPFVAVGTSAGASQISFALVYFGFDAIVDLAILGSGPPLNPFCPTCPPSQAQAQREEQLLTGTPRLHYPTTTVRFLLAEREPNQLIVRDARALHDAITSAKSIQVLVDTEHNIEQFAVGQEAILRAVREIAPR